MGSRHQQPIESATPNRPWVAAAVAAGAVAAGGFAIASVATALISRAVVVPPRRPVEPVRIHDVSGDLSSVTLAVTPDTVLPGKYSLFFGNGTGHAKVGEVLRIDNGRVERAVHSVDIGSLGQARWGRLSGWYYLDPRELGVPVEDVFIPTEVGNAPAWYVPSGSEHGGRDAPWVISIHGRNVRRGEAIRAIPVVREAGYHHLLISYRNDRDAPNSADGRLMLGQTEWRDVESAVEWAISRGARRIILMGWSMGGAIALQTVTRSRHRRVIVGLILESPVVNWIETLNYRAQVMRLPDGISRAVRRTITQPWGSRVTGLGQPIDLPRLDFVTRSDDLDCPILLMHSDDDGYVASTSSRLLAQARPDIVTFESFSVARHTKLWNFDPERWNAVMTSWLIRMRAAHEPAA